MKRQIIPIFMDGDTPSPTPTDNYAVNLSMSMDSNYIISAQLIDQDGNVLGDEQTIDLPLESVVVSGSYDSNTKSIILTLDNGNTITIPVADLVSGLQTEITSQNPLSADLITDGTTNKVFTASDKQSLMDAISATSNLGTMAYQDASNYTPSASLSSVATTGSYNDLTNKPTIPTSTSQLTNDSGFITGITSSDVTTALGYTPGTSNFSGSYNDLTSKPDLSIYAQSASLSSVATSGDYDDLVNKPNLAPVATSGSYNDLTNKPQIPAAQVNSDWSANSGVSEILNKPDLSIYAESANLATVATSGDYSDLSNTPTIPTVNDATITLTQGGVTKGTFTLNQSSNATIDFGQGMSSVDWSDINNKPNFATVATSGDYDDLTDKPTLGTMAAESASDYTPTSSLGSMAFANTSDYTTTSSLAAVATSGDYLDLSNTPSLATVATSGSYNDLSNKPTIPTATSDLNNDSGFITGITSTDVTTALGYTPSSFSGSYTDLTNKPDLSIYAQSSSLATVATSGSYDDLTNKPTIPAAQIQSDWTQTTTTALDYIKNKPNLATVATSGSYNDLSNKPTIPTVNNAALSIKKDSGTKVDIYSANASTAETINLVGGTNVTLTEDTSTANTYKMTIAHSTPSGATTKTSGFYKFSTDSQGHVNGTTAVATSDISALLSSQTLTFVDGQGNTTTITFYTTA